ncbi:MULTISPECIES: hypothetical protein [Buttiauxella]|uniref:hypothetical protein n=1 Tax=Buttiauxella TaxID=82976 RepID=UPI00105C42AD|nr:MULTISPECIES: hypothetical protein [Buttiauxella]TDN52961.1 hypothetical protein EC843_102399 [Buttiauxella sp. JUb87]UNK62112.1 hypothetical protein MNO13_03910 [Buttiauxella ferragutiae]
MRNKICYLLLSLLVFTAESFSAVNINIGQLNDTLESNKNTLQKKIYNAGDSTAFVQIEVVEVNINYKGEESELKPDRDKKNISFMASPSRLIIPGDSFQVSRIVFTGTREYERYFRVRYMPVQPNENNNFGLSPDQIKDNDTNTLKAGMGLSIGYGTLVVVRPNTSIYSTRINDGANEFKVVNSGNTVAILRYTNTCSNVTKKCHGFGEDLNVYPGQSRVFLKEKDSTHSFTLVEGGNSRKIKLP